MLYHKPKTASMFFAYKNWQIKKIYIYARKLEKLHGFLLKAVTLESPTNALITLGQIKVDGFH